MSSPMEIHEIAGPPQQPAVLAMSGELDLLAAPELYQRGAQAIEEHHSLILELSGVTFCDSSGFNALIRLHRRAEEAGGRLVLAAPPEQVLRLLTLSGTDGFFPTRPNLAEARLAAAAPTPSPG